MALTIGTKLGPYEIQASLGAGGMGEVYKARDTRLDRTVAVKVLPGHVASDPDLKHRFEREAKALAALSHPHICPIHDVGSQDGIDFLVMEHLEGETLAQRLSRRALPLDQALRTAIEIAAALDKAHRMGIVHRDLKPGNIMLTKGGAKLLDFGLAKLNPAQAKPVGISTTTSSVSLTGEGAILGTLGYMAPEQLEGKDSDARTDIFAFGLVLYETITGRRVFDGDSQASLVAAIMHVQPPPPSSIKHDVSPILDHVVQTCLAKDPESRWQSMGDVARQLQWVTSAQLSAGKASVARRPRFGSIAVAASALATVVVLGLWMTLGTTVPTPSVMRTTVTLQTGVELVAEGGASASLALSPDGRLLAYVGRRDVQDQLYLREFDAFEATPVSGTNGATYPFFSPDSRSVAFFADGQLKRVSVAGGAPVVICAAPTVGRGGTWSPDGTIVYDAGTPGLMQVPAAGGVPGLVTSADPEMDALNHRWPRFLPGGEALLTSVGSRLLMLSWESGQWAELGAGNQPTYVPSGHLVYHAGEGDVHAVPFDLDALEATGAPVSVLDGVFRAGDSGAAFFAISQSGTLAYAPYGLARRLVRVDRNGTRTPLSDDVRGFRFPRFSPDGRRVAVSVDTRPSELWVYDLERRSSIPLTADGHNLPPVWTPDGRRVAYGHDDDLWWRVWDASSPAELLLERPGVQYPKSWSPDGQLLAFIDGPGEGVYDVWTLPLDGEPRPLLVTPATEGEPRFSPDGRWLAYESDVSDRFEVYVRPFPEVSELRVPISTGGGQSPQWSQDGTELFYMSGAAVMAVSLRDTGDTLVPALPERLFDGPFDVQQPWNFDVAPDGQSFVMIEIDPELTPSRIQVVQNWTSELQRLVPTR